MGGASVEAETYQTRGLMPFHLRGLVRSWDTFHLLVSAAEVLSEELPRILVLVVVLVNHVEAGFLESTRRRFTTRNGSGDCL